MTPEQERLLNELKWAVFGLDGENGLRSEFRRLNKKLDDFIAVEAKRREQERREQEKHREQEAVERRADRRMYITVSAGFATALVVALIGLAQAGLLGGG